MKPGYLVRDTRAAVRSKRPRSFMRERCVPGKKAVHETRTRKHKFHAKNSHEIPRLRAVCRKLSQPRRGEWAEGAGAQPVGFVWRAAAELWRARGFLQVHFPFLRGPAHACID